MTERRDPVVGLAAAGAAGIYLSFAGLQVALAAGAPLGEHVWGGSQGQVLSPRMRVVAVGSGVVLVSMAHAVGRRAGYGGPPARWTGPATWATAAYTAINTAGNLASTSSVERSLFGPATAVAAALTATVAWRTRS